MNKIYLTIEPIPQNFTVETESLIASLPSIIDFTQGSPNISIETETLFGTPTVEFSSMGLPGKEGPRGKDGILGGIPKHQVVSPTEIRFETPDGSWGETLNFNQLAYNSLEGKPSIESVELVGNKNFDDFGLSSIELEDINNLL